MGTPRKVVIIGPAYPLRGGIAQLNESLSRELTRQGIENVIYSFSLQYPSILFPGQTQYDTSSAAPLGISVKSVINSINPFSWLRTAKAILNERPDLIIVRFWIPFMGPALGTICKLIKRSSNVRIIGLLDNVIPHEKRFGDHAFTEYFLDKCDSFAVMSSSVMNELGQFDSNKPRKLLYHPIYHHFGEQVTRAEAREKLALPQDAKILLFFGIVRPYKGLDILLEAMAKVNGVASLKLIVAGEFYEDRDKYDRLIQQLGLSDKVIIHDGFVAQEDVRHYFSAADMVAQTYRSATQSGVTQIAYHFGTPMLVTNVGGLSELVPHGKVGYVCKVSPDDVANAIVDFFENDRYAIFQKNIGMEKHRFSWEFFAKELLFQEN